MDTVLPQSRVENDKDKQLYDMVQIYSSGEISCEQYTVLLGLNANQERNYETIALNFYIYKKRQYPAKTATSISPW
jgi:hypothetical protein